MFKLIKSNLREIIVLLFLLPLMLFGLAALGDPTVAANGHLSELLSLGVSLLGGILKFSVCLALAWFGLSVTFPEAGRFMFGTSFDVWWEHTPLRFKGYVSLGFAAVLVIAAALCMAS